MKKGLKIVISVISILLVLFLIFLGVYYFWPWNRDFFDKAKEEFSIPGLNDGFVPQGFSAFNGYNQYLISGYMKDGSPSRVYLIDGETGEIIKWFTLKIGNDSSVGSQTFEGRYYDGHAGGIVHFGQNVYVVSSYVLKPDLGSKGYAFRFLTTDIEKVKSGESITIVDYFETYNNADFAFVYQHDLERNLYVGEFYKDKKYSTSEYHHITTPSGDKHSAMIYGFELNNTGFSYGLEKKTPQRVISIGDCVQGISVTPTGKIVVSSSYGIADSHLYFYDAVLNKSAENKIKLGLYEYPIYYLDSSSLISSMSIPSMSEEIVADDDNVHILFESGAKKYRIFNRKRLTNVYSLPIRHLER